MPKPFGTKVSNYAAQFLSSVAEKINASRLPNPKAFSTLFNPRDEQRIGMKKNFSRIPLVVGSTTSKNVSEKKSMVGAELPEQSY
ncbi:hypothetical protein FRB94_001633 [Tulasnella sp. JGI-2019a]|nr:hypothetical protein FRB94_001633 [Tulasnella sp. JGI-2019a]KAG9036863.1 hypothetical protein FRB95_007708 [Tulasnella sp. JGI-2019a]